MWRPSFEKILKIPTSYNLCSMMHVCTILAFLGIWAILCSSQPWPMMYDRSSSEPSFACSCRQDAPYSRFWRKYSQPVDVQDRIDRPMPHGPLHLANISIRGSLLISYSPIHHICVCKHLKAISSYWQMLAYSTPPPSKTHHPLDTYR